jgi:hypothetical protein
MSLPNEDYTKNASFTKVMRTLAFGSCVLSQHNMVVFFYDIGANADDRERSYAIHIIIVSIIRMWIIYD